MEPPQMINAGDLVLKRWEPARAEEATTTGDLAGGISLMARMGPGVVRERRPRPSESP